MAAHAGYHQILQSLITAQASLGETSQMTGPLWPEGETGTYYYGYLGYSGDMENYYFSMLNTADTSEISQKKVYMRFDYTDGDNDTDVIMIVSDTNGGSMILVVLHRNLSSVSAIGTLPALSLIEFSSFYPVSPESSVASAVSSISLKNPVCIVIDDYADFWASQELTTDAAIKEYLDGLDFSDFG